MDGVAGSTVHRVAAWWKLDVSAITSSAPLQSVEKTTPAHAVREDECQLRKHMG